MRRFTPQRGTVLWLLAFVVVAWALTRAPIVEVVIAALIVGAVLKVGIVVLGSLATPIPEPPPPGELRKVKLMYRCTICGTEVRMTSANDQMPEPPRHCLEDMALVTPVDDL
jgi:hypothetical protein